MSLINQMLQELDARRAEGLGDAGYGEQIRVAPDKRRMHSAWWVALVLALLLVAVVAWTLLRPPPQVTPRPLPLKMDWELAQQQRPLPQVSARRPLPLIAPLPHQPRLPTRKSQSPCRICKRPRRSEVCL